MGSGKTEVGKLLAQKLGKTYREMDVLVLEKSKMKNINEIFEKEGELRFRELEIAVAKDLQNTTNDIIATGGGVVINKIILDYLKQNKTIIIYLQTNFDIISRRLKGDTLRPLFRDKERAKQLYAIREPLYKQYADIIVTTDNQSLTDITMEIITRIKNV